MRVLISTTANEGRFGPLLPVMARLPTLSFEDANATVLRDVFGRIDAQAAFPALSAAIEDWQPAVLVREPAEFGSLVVNARHVAAVGAGRAVSPGPAAISAACAEVCTVLGEPAYGVQARSLAEAVAALPPATEAVSVVERAAR